MSVFKRFLRDESGATAIEYGLIAAGISVAIIATVNTLGGQLKNTFSNVSSQLGQLQGMADGYPAYRVSKAALNALTRILAAGFQGDKVLVNSACPGWVKTDMGGPNAPGTVEQGADTPVWLATLPDDGPTGGFFQGRKPLAW